MSKILHEISSCEICGNTKLDNVLNLGLHPMCDDLIQVGQDQPCQEYPIEILLCNKCKTAFQKFQIPKELLFPQTYHYRSRHTKDVINGMNEFVASCINKLENLSKIKVLDVGCNDGSLLKIFQNKGANVYGIEPTGAYLDARQNGITIIHDYLIESVANQFIENYGKPDLIVFTNVFAHIQNFKQLLSCLKILKHSETIIVIENHYLGSILKGMQFDTFYHEHPRTYSYSSFVKIAEELEMTIRSVEFPSRYGGNIRVFMQSGNGKDNRKPTYSELIQSEVDFDQQFKQLRAEIQIWQKAKKIEIERAVNKHGPLIAKAFPGRAAIPIKMLGIDSTLVRGVYEKPLSKKIGHYVPGTKIPILPDDSLLLDLPKGAPILNLAWHIRDEIESYMHEMGFDGEFIQII